MILTISPPELGPQNTFSTADITAGAIYTLVENNNDFASGDLIVLGQLGEEKTEIVVASGTTSVNQIDHAACLFDHSARTFVSQILYDQAEISRATSEGGTYAVVTTIDLNVDEEYTMYNDTAGTTSSWYKIRYKNSQTTVYSDYSDEVQGTGYDENSLKAMSDDVLEAFGDTNSKQITRAQVRTYLNAGVRRILMKMLMVFPDYGGAYSTQALTSGTYNYPTNFVAFKRINIGSSITDSFRAEFKKETELDPAATYSEVDPKIYLRDTTWGVYPNCTGKTAYLYYWQYPTAMANDTDTHGLPYGARDVLVTYATYRCWLDKDTDRAKSLKTHMDEQMKEFIEFVGQSRQASNNYFQTVSFGSDLYE